MNLIAYQSSIWKEQTAYTHYIPATVFPWQRTPATFDALHEVVVDFVQSISRDSLP